MNKEELKKEVEKFKSVREKVLRLNEITKFTYIIYGRDCIQLTYKKSIIDIVEGDGECLFCESVGPYPRFITLKVKNRNFVFYYSCYNCKHKTLCTYCLNEKQNCYLIAKTKIAFMLSTKNIFPKDIQRLIANLFFCFFSKTKKTKI